MEVITRKKILEINRELIRLEKYNNDNEIFRKENSKICNAIENLKNLKNKIIFEESLKEKINKTK